MTYDLVSLGEVMLRLSPPRFDRLRQATRLDVHVAGSQLNVAANLAQLGKRTAFVSLLPANELGVLARGTCQGYGVDVSHLRLVEGSRMGVNYVEFGATPRAEVAVYDRAGSAASTIAADDFAWADILRGTRLAYTDGIFPGLGTGCFEATLAFLQTAREVGCFTCFDVNYREHLWTGERARAAWGEILPLVDVLATNRSVAEAVFAYEGADDDLLAQFQAEFGCRTVCLTSRTIDGVLRGGWSSKALHDGRVIQGRRYDFDVIDRFGTGDAWFAGFLYGYLDTDVSFALDFGDALCALAHTMEGDVARVSAAEVLPLLAAEPDLRVRR
jgi:2-dehydro-3-deoxygluconokinase